MLSTNIQIKNDETLEDLGIDGLKIIQKREGFRFGLDALAISDFANIKKNDRVCELGCGSAVISLLLAKRKPCKSITSVEIDETYCDMASRCVKLNGLGDMISIINSDVTSFAAEPGNNASLDAIVCNPPYFEISIGNNSIARQEVSANLSDWIAAASSLLVNRGRAYFVFTTTRIAELMHEFEKNSLSVKKLRFIQHSPDKSPKIFLIEGVKNANLGTIILPTMILHDNEGNKSTDWLKLYHEK